MDLRVYRIHGSPNLPGPMIYGRIPSPSASPSPLPTPPLCRPLPLRKKAPAVTPVIFCLFKDCSKLLINSWSHDPGIVASDTCLPQLNEALQNSCVFVQVSLFAFFSRFLVDTDFCFKPRTIFFFKKKFYCQKCSFYCILLNYRNIPITRK